MWAEGPIPTARFSYMDCESRAVDETSDTSSRKLARFPLYSLTFARRRSNYALHGRYNGCVDQHLRITLGEIMRNRNLMIGAGLSALAAGAVATYAYRIRPWHLRWGATDKELDQR